MIEHDDLHDHQHYFLRASDNGAYVGGRQSGKSTAARLKSVREAYNDEDVYFVVAQQRMLREQHKETRKFLESEDIEFEEVYSSGPRKLSIENYGTIHFVSAFDGLEQHIRGATTVVVDEFQEIKQEARKTLLSVDSTYFTGSYGRNAPAHYLMDNDDWTVTLTPTTMMPHINGAWAERMQMERGADTFAQEMMARLVDLSSKHTLAVPEEAHPTWEVRCVDCGFNRNVPSNQATCRVKKYLIGEAVETVCRP